MLDFIKTIMNANKSYIDSKITKSRSDWNQNDSSANDYIKNRTHYETNEIIVVFDETIEFSNENPVEWEQTKVGYIHEPIELSLVEGKEYSVTFDGIEYLTTCFIDNEFDNVVIGNGAFVYDSNEDNGLPFVIGNYDIDESEAYIIVGDTNSHTIRIIEEKHYIKKLDKKYIPEDYATINLVEETQTTANDALSRANVAQTTANDALSRANVAQTTAEEALSSANVAQDNIKSLRSDVDESFTEMGQIIEENNNKALKIESVEILSEFVSTSFSLCHGQNALIAYTPSLSYGYYSKDGISWEKIYFNYYINRMSFGNGIFCALINSVENSTAKVIYSEDGINWSEYIQVSDTISSLYTKLIYANGNFVIYGNSKSGSNVAYKIYSKDGINWYDEVELVGLSKTTDTVINYIGGKFFCFHTSSFLPFYSLDGINWSICSYSNRGSVPNNEDFDSSDAIYINNIFYKTLVKGVAYSEDGITWTYISLNHDYPLKEIIYYNNNFMIYGSDGSIFTSEDGLNWNKSDIITEYIISNITYIDSKLVAVAFHSNKILYSEDGLNWEYNVYYISQNNEDKTELIKKIILKDGLVQSDWNQNDETAEDYIKNKPFDVVDSEISAESENPIQNKVVKAYVEESMKNVSWNELKDRPFYEEGEETVLFDDEITFSPSGEMQGITQIPYFEIEQGKTYKIDWNGHTYECTSKQFEIDDGVFISYLGNAVLFEEEDTGENFLFYVGKDEAGENVSVAAYIPMTESKIPNERVIPCKIYHDGKIIHKLPNKFIDAEWVASDNLGAITILEEKEYTGGQTFRSYEETAINIQKVVEYESVTVICNGNEYECKPIYDEDDGSGEGDVFFLGNAGMWSEKYPNTGEPFMLMAYIGGVVILGVNTNEPYTFGIKRKNIVPIPTKYLPKGYGCLGEKGTADIIFEQEVTLENEDGMVFGLIDTTIEFIEGDMYVLQLGETDYECVARSLTQTMDGVTATATWIGNAGIMGMENTGEPFLVVTQPMGEDENGNLTYGTLLVTEVFLDENVPVKITHTTSTPTIQFDEALIPGEWKACKKIESFTIMEETELTGNKTYGSSTAIGISFDKAMKNDLESASVIFNGTMYENVPIGFVPDELDPNVKQWYIGKLDTANNSYFSTFPFLITGVPYGFTSIYVQDTTTPYTIEAIGNKAVYDKIPDKYLPSDWNAKAEYEYTTTILDIEVPIYTSEHYDVEWQENLEQQKSVKVTFDGVLYECEVYVIYQSDGSVGEVKIGNRSLYNENHWDSGEPFYIERINWASREAELGIYVADKTVTHTLLLKGQTNVNKIPDMFLPDNIARKEDLQNLGGGSSNDLRLIKTIELAEDVAIIEPFTTDDNGEEFDLEEIVITSDNLALADGVTDNNASWRVWVYTRNSYWDSNNSDIFGSNIYIEPYLCTNAAMAFFCNIKIIDEYNIAIVKANDKNGNVLTRSLKSTGNHIQRISFKSNNHNSTLFKAGTIIKVYGR